jgi:hypothetical protein
MQRAAHFFKSAPPMQADTRPAAPTSPKRHNSIAQANPEEKAVQVRRHCGRRHR